MSLRLFHDRGVASVTERRPLVPSCIDSYTPALRAGTSVRRTACAHEKITCS